MAASAFAAAFAAAVLFASIASLSLAICDVRSLVVWSSLSISSSLSEQLVNPIGIDTVNNERSARFKKRFFIINFFN
jgi:hypothetical protein